MAKLTLAQIDALIQQAIDAGMQPEEAAGVRDMLLMRVSELSAEDKLRLAIEQLPADQRAYIDEALQEMGALNERIVSRGRAALEALSDEEWDALVDAANERDDDGQ